MPILVTGGSGHLGANLVRRLLADGHAVRALVRHGSDNSALDRLDLERVYGDLRDAAAMAMAVKGCERVFHAAAKLSTVGGGEREIFECNVMGTRNLLTAARQAGVKRVVVTGSFSAVGHRHDRPSDETVPFYPFEEVMAYEQTKVLVEHETLRAVAEGLDAVIATSCAILGPHDHKPSRMGQTLLDFANGKMHAWIQGGFEFVATHDIVAGHLLAMDKGRTGQKYIFSTEYMTVDRLMGIFEEVTGRPRPRLCLPAPLMYGIASVASPIMTRFFPSMPQRLTPGAIRILRLGRHADTTKARTELGFKPISVERAVGEAYDDFVRRGLIGKPHRRVIYEIPVDAKASAGTPRRGHGDPARETGTAGMN